MATSNSSAGDPRELSLEDAAAEYARVHREQGGDAQRADSKNWTLGEIVCRTKGVKRCAKSVYGALRSAADLEGSHEMVRLQRVTFTVFPTDGDRCAKRPWTHHAKIIAPVKKLLKAEGTRKPKPAEIAKRALLFLQDETLKKIKDLRQAIADATPDQIGSPIPSDGKRKLVTVEKILKTLADEIKDGKVEKPELAVDIWERQLRRIRPMPLREFAAVADATRRLPSLIDATNSSAQLAQLLRDFIRTQVSTAKAETRDMTATVIRRVVEGELERVLNEIAKTNTKAGKTDAAA